jgi:hypothetical protein
MPNAPETLETAEGFKGLTISTRKYESVEGSTGFRGIAASTNKNQFIESQEGFKGLSISCLYKGKVTKVTHY